MKAYGFPLIDYGNRNIYGRCYTEDGKYLGQHTSSDLWFLEHDLSTKADSYDYVFIKDPTLLPEIIREILKGEKWWIGKT